MKSVPCCFVWLTIPFPGCRIARFLWTLPRLTLQNVAAFSLRSIWAMIYRQIYQQQIGAEKHCADVSAMYCPPVRSTERWWKLPALLLLTTSAFPPSPKKKLLISKSS